MPIEFIDINFGPSESYSRQLDRRVERQEMPYGYEAPPPPYDTHDYNSHARESHKEYPRKRHR